MTPVEKRLAGLLLGAAAASSLFGLRWGLPSGERADLVLTPSQRTAAFYDTLARTRDKIYENLDLFNPIPVAKASDPAAFREQLLRSYSSFLVRTLDGDEQRAYVALSTMDLRRLRFDPQYHYSYGGPYLALLGGFLLAGKLAGLLALSPDIRFYYANPGEMARVFVAGRCLSAASALLAAWLFFRLARRLMGLPWAFTASLLFILAPINLFLSHVVKPHLLATAFALGGILSCLDLMDDPTPRAHARAGAWLGLAVGTTLNVWPVVLLVPWMRRRNLRWDGLSIAGGAFVAVFLLTSPFILTHPKAWLSEITYQASFRPVMFNLKGISAVIHTVLFRGFGAVPFVLAAGGLLALLKRRTSPAQGPLAGFFLAYLVLFILQFGHYAAGCPSAARYMAPAFPFLALFVGWGLERLAARGRRLAAAAAALTLLVAAEQTVFALANYVRDNPRDSVGFSAGRWINANLPPGTKIGLQYNLLTYRHPPFRFGDYALSVHSPGERLDPGSAPEYFILSADPPLDLDPTKPPLPSGDFLTIYAPVQSFTPSRAGGTVDYFSSANFPIWIYGRKD